MSDVLLKAENLKKSFATAGERVEALRGVSLTIGPGEVLAFLGPNGAGKTTTIRILAGLVAPDAGSVRIAGRDPLLDAAALEAIGTVLEGNRNLYWRLTAQENLDYFGALKKLSRSEARRQGGALLERFGLAQKERAPVQALSRGMQQKVAIAVALVHKPRLLLLDEPTLGLDVEAAEDVKDLIRDIVREGCGVLLTTHQLEVAEELSDRISIIKDGAILVEADTREIIKRFSGESFTISVDGAPGEPQIRILERLGAVVEGERVVFRGEPDELYGVLAALRPLPLIRVEKDAANLTDVFLRLMKETSHAEPVSSRV